MRSNNLSFVPDELGRLPRLRVLNLSDNKLSFLPYSLTRLKQLQALWLAENQVHAYCGSPRITYMRTVARRESGTCVLWLAENQVVVHHTRTYCGSPEIIRHMRTVKAALCTVTLA